MTPTVNGVWGQADDMRVSNWRQATWKMTPSEFDMLRELVKADESLRLFVYDDATGEPIKAGSTVVGNPTIGYGCELSKTGITEAEAGVLLDNRLQQCVANVTRVHPDVLTLDPVRQIALVNMAFNLGVAGIGAFHDMWAAIDRQDWQGAAAAMLDSAAARELPNRYQRLSELMRTGELK